MAKLIQRFNLTGVVTKGFGRGSKELGCPTANMDEKAVLAAAHLSTAAPLHHGKKDGLSYTLLQQNPNQRGILLIPGFTSGKSTSECEALTNYCMDHSKNFLCYDPRGVGDSPGRFQDFLLSHWVEDACSMIDVLTEATNMPPILLGQSLGGSIAAHIAQEQLRHFHSLLLVCPAVCYTHPFHSFVTSIISPVQLTALNAGEVITVDLGDFEDWEPFPYSLALRDSFLAHHLSTNTPIPGDFPVRLVQGMADQTIPYQFILKLGIQDHFQTNDLRIQLVKAVDHLVMSSKEGLRTVAGVIEELTTAH